MPKPPKKKNKNESDSEEEEEGKKPKGKFQKGEKLPKPPTHKVVNNDGEEDSKGVDEGA